MQRRINCGSRWKQSWMRSTKQKKCIMVNWLTMKLNKNLSGIFNGSAQQRLQLWKEKNVKPNTKLSNLSEKCKDLSIKKKRKNKSSNVNSDKSNTKQKRRSEKKLLKLNSWKKLKLTHMLRNSKFVSNSFISALKIEQMWGMLLMSKLITPKNPTRHRKRLKSLSLLEKFKQLIASTKTNWIWNRKSKKSVEKVLAGCMKKILV